MGEKGRALLREMERLNIILDATHLCDESFWESLDLFRGPVWASHNNCRALVPHSRQFSDDQLRALIARGAVIGVVFDAWMLVPDWVRGTSTPQNRGVTLAQVADNIDHVCQVAGNALHAGIGSDLDGGFGTEQGPADVDTIADLQKLPALLADAAIRRRTSRTCAAGTSCAPSERRGAKHPYPRRESSPGLAAAGQRRSRRSARRRPQGRSKPGPPPDSTRLPGLAGQRVCGRRLQRPGGDGGRPASRAGGAAFARRDALPADAHHELRRAVGPVRPARARRED